MNARTCVQRMSHAHGPPPPVKKTTSLSLNDLGIASTLLAHDRIQNPSVK